MEFYFRLLVDAARHATISVINRSDMPLLIFTVVRIFFFFLIFLENNVCSFFSTNTSSFSQWLLIHSHKCKDSLFLKVRFSNAIMFFGFETSKLEKSVHAWKSRAALLSLAWGNRDQRFKQFSSFRKKENFAQHFTTFFERRHHMSGRLVFL